VLFTEDEDVEDEESEKRLTHKLMMVDTWRTKARNKKERRNSSPSTGYSLSV